MDADEDDDEDEEEDEEEQSSMPILKPKFVSKYASHLFSLTMFLWLGANPYCRCLLCFCRTARDTLAERERVEAEELALELQEKARVKERAEETKQIVVQQVGIGKELSKPAARLPFFPVRFDFVF